MKPLETNRRVLMWLGLYPFDNTLNKRYKVCFIIVGSLIFAVALSACISSEIFVMKHVTNNLEDSLYAIGQILIYWNVLYLMMFALVQRDKIVVIIENLTKIHDKCMI